MKKVKILLLMLTLMCGTSALYAQDHRNAVGFNLGYATGCKGINNLGIGVKYDYSFSENLRVEPSFTYYFDNKKIGQKDANINFQYLFNLDTDEKLHFYPIFGFTTLFGKEKDKVVEKDGVVQKNDDGTVKTENDSFFRFGCNLGVGLQYDITEDFGLVGEIKYKLVKDFGQADFAIGCVVTF